VNLTLATEKSKKKQKPSSDICMNSGYFLIKFLKGEKNKVKPELFCSNS